MADETTSAGAAGRRLSRARDGAVAPAPIRMVHLGAGNFFRAHQAWYTESCDDGPRWGIAAFTGRSSRVADDLRGQDGLYTLRVQGGDRNTDTVMSCLSAVHSSTEQAAWAGYFSRPELALATLTVTEAGYLLPSFGQSSGHSPAGEEALRADVESLRRDGARAQAATAPAKLLAGFLARREALGAAAPIAVLPCDNIPDNGRVVGQALQQLAQSVDPGLARWMTGNVSYVDTMVDRITPRTTDEDRRRLTERTGVHDPALVITEPYTEWVLSGGFPNGRPAWESGGARFVSDVGPYTARKLLLLNGAHTLMAYGGSLLGHATMAQAMADPVVRGWVEDWWALVGGQLDLPAAEIRAYCASLVERFANPSIEHRLAQTAADGSEKVLVRVVPVLRRALAAGAPAPAATRTVAAWICHLRGLGTAPVDDVRRAQLRRMVGTDARAAVRAIHALLGLPADDALTAVVERQVRELAELSEVSSRITPGRPS